MKSPIKQHQIEDFNDMELEARFKELGFDNNFESTIYFEPHSPKGDEFIW